MSFQKNSKPQNDGKETPRHTHIVPQQPVRRSLALSTRLEELESLPKRGAILHWLAFTLALLSFGLLAMWVFNPPEHVPGLWLILDIALSVIFAIEFFTRSGFRWYGLKYIRGHFFDFIAIVPALPIINHGVYLQDVWIWIILVARFIRLIDRFLGDGFVTRNALGLVTGLEEEITDRVLDRIVGRIQSNLDKADLSHKVAEALTRNRESILSRVREATPREGLVPSIARFVGLDAALERAEERSFDTILGIIDSEEVEHALRDAINTSFTSFRDELGRKSWHEHLGFQVPASKAKKPPAAKS